MKIPFRINHINVSQFAIFPENAEGAEDIEIQTEITFKITKGARNILCKTIFSYLNGDKVIMKLDLENNFEVSSEGAAAIIKEKKVSVDFQRYLATISTGTARGVIYAKSEGTVVSSLVLPPINLTEFIKDDVILT